MEIVEDVVIVGGGIAGLSTALALMRVGVQSLVLERSDMLRTTGAALTLGPNAWVALDALGVADQLTSIYTPFQKQYITNVANGAVQEVLFSGSDTNIALRTVHRSTLLETLARELPANTIRFSAKMKSIQTLQHGESSITVLSLEDGTIIKAKVVIGCDGVHSVVAKWLGLATPIRSSRSAVRGLAVFPQGHGLQHEIHQFLDRDNRAGFVPLNDKELYWFITYESRLNEDDYMKTKDPESIQKNILDSMAHFPKVYLDVVRHADLNTVSWAPLVFRAPWDLLYKSLSKGNVTVAGDAMHPTMPDLAQGGCAALEDAVVLGRHIGNSLIQNGKIVTEAVEGYVKERRWRVAGVIAASFLSGWVQVFPQR
ncbi:hypothetical protein ACHQM5_022178 [Ranunculus cassubicifolius]